MTGGRHCNVGPVPDYSYDDLVAAMIHYIDSESKDEALFELGKYAEKTKGSGLVLPALASLSLLICSLLVVAPAARLHKVDIRSSFLDALAERPRRIVFPRIPKGQLAETTARQVDSNSVK